MKTRIEFEVQVNTPSTGHGWRAIGGRDGRVYFSEDDSIHTRLSIDAYPGPRDSRCARVIDDLKIAIKRIRRDWELNYCQQRELRIVKIETTTTYEVIE